MKITGGESKVSTFEQYVIDVVYRLRTERNMTQSDIAGVLGVSTSFIGNVEHSTNPAKYNLKHINTLAAYLGISPKDFVPSESDYHDV